MAELKLSDGKIISDYGRPYVIAEVNSSHNGSVETAREMIKAAYDSGCDCVKFQSWSPESLYSKTYYDKNPISKRIVQKFSLSAEQLFDMANYCHELGIGFSSTPYSNEEVEFLVDKCKIPFIKIASMEINNPEFLTYIAKKQVPIILSTGMAELDEIKKAVKTIEAAGNNQICLLHCISIYPAAPETINLNNILMLRKEFPQYPIGFSDHTLGYGMACAAVALGVAVIEKHITLDKNKMGMDNNMAIEPDEMKLLVDNCRNVQLGMGNFERVVSELEYKQRLNMRRSIIAVKDLEAGTVLTKDMLSAKRPGNGIAPDKIETLLGKKLNKNINADSLIFIEDIE